MPHSVEQWAENAFAFAEARSQLRGNSEVKGWACLRIQHVVVSHSNQHRQTHESGTCHCYVIKCDGYFAVIETKIGRKYDLMKPTPVPFIARFRLRHYTRPTADDWSRFRR